MAATFFPVPRTNNQWHPNRSGPMQ